MGRKILSNKLKEKKAELQEKFKKYNWTGSLDDYLDLLVTNPLPSRNARQRVRDRIYEFGYSEKKIGKEVFTEYNFFLDPNNGGRDSVFGLLKTKNELVDFLDAAANDHKDKERLLLLRGPVASAKSTLVRLIKKELVQYTKEDAGAIYTFGWKLDSKLEDKESLKVFEHEGHNYQLCQMHEDPLNLLPRSIRADLIAELNDKIKSSELNKKLFKNLDSYLDQEGNINFKIEDNDLSLCTSCERTFTLLSNQYDGDLDKVLDHVAIKRFLFSERRRVGIGTFQPKDEKNQDSTELTGDINYRKLAEYGSDSDPRAFEYDGEFNIANRGVIEFVEILKLDLAFLYDLLGATQEHKIKPKKQPQMDIDELIISHTNLKEYDKLMRNELMLAIRSRTKTIDVPYLTTLDDEIKIHTKDLKRYLSGERMPHIAPHAILAASMFAILTRLDDPTGESISLMDKLKLYNGQRLSNISEEQVSKMRELSKGEALTGIDTRYIQNCLSKGVTRASKHKKCLNPLSLLKIIKDDLTDNSTIRDVERLDDFKMLITAVEGEISAKLVEDVQEAMSFDEAEIVATFDQYIDNVLAYCAPGKEKVYNSDSEEYEEPSEKLMSEIEEDINMSAQNTQQFRHGISAAIAGLNRRNEEFTYKSDASIEQGLRKRAYKNKMKSVDLRLLSHKKEKDTKTKEKLDTIKGRLIDKLGYCSSCATLTMNYVGRQASDNS